MCTLFTNTFLLVAKLCLITKSAIFWYRHHSARNLYMLVSGSKEQMAVGFLLVCTFWLQMAGNQFTMITLFSVKEPPSQ